MSPQLIVSEVTFKTQYDNLTDSVSNIFTSGPYGRQFSEYYAGLNYLLDMIDLLNPNAVSLFSSDFTFLMNLNGTKKDRYIRIVSDIIEVPTKGIFFANQFHTAGHFYDDNPFKLGWKQGMVTPEVR